MDSKMSDTLRFYWSAVYLIGFLLPLVAVLVSFSGLFRFVRKREFTDRQHRSDMWATGLHGIIIQVSLTTKLIGDTRISFKEKLVKMFNGIHQEGFQTDARYVLPGIHAPLTDRNQERFSEDMNLWSLWKPSKVNSTGNNDHHAQVKYTIIRTTIVYTITVTCSWLPVIILVRKVFTRWYD